MTEEVVPDVRLTRSKDGGNGTATFVFNQPSVFEASSEFGDITGLYMLDDEGEILTVEVSAKFVNGKPDRIEAIHIMRSAGEWDRFMRFMERYSEEKGLGFKKVTSFLNVTFSGLCIIACQRRQGSQLNCHESACKAKDCVS